MRISFDLDIDCEPSPSGTVTLLPGWWRRLFGARPISTKVYKSSGSWYYATGGTCENWLSKRLTIALRWRPIGDLPLAKIKARRNP